MSFMSLSHKRRRHGTKANVQPKTREEIKANFINDMKSIEGVADDQTVEDFWNKNIKSKEKEAIQQSIGNVQIGMKVPGADAGLVSAIETFINKAETAGKKGKILAAFVRIAQNIPILEEGLKRQTSEEGKRLFVEGNTGNTDDARRRRSIFQRLKSKKAGKRKRRRKTRKKRRRRTKKKRRRRKKKRRRTRK